MMQICDFGLSQSAKGAVTRCGTPGYLAPEVADGSCQVGLMLFTMCATPPQELTCSNKTTCMQLCNCDKSHFTLPSPPPQIRVTSKADVYSFGRTMQDMLQGRCYQVSNSLLSELKLELLIEACMEPCPTDRPTLEGAHKWLQSINYRWFQPL